MVFVVTFSLSKMGFFPKIADVFWEGVLFTELGALPVKFFKVNFFFFSFVLIIFHLSSH